MWKEIVDAAEERGSFSIDENQRAGNFRSCAISENPLIPRHVEETLLGLPDEWHFKGEPIDNVLKELSIEFYDAVDANRFEWCRRLLKQIQKRELQILTEGEANDLQRI